MINKDAVWWNNGECSKRSAHCPGEGFIKGRLKFKRKPHSKKSLEKMASSLKGRTPWNKGLKDIYSKESLEKMSKSAKDRASRGIMPDNTGKTPWNKGLSKESDIRVLEYAEKQTGQTRSGDYATGELNGNWNANTDEYNAYANRVRYLSEIVYNDNVDIINPNGYLRGRAGVEDAYHLDHIVPIHYGFTNNIEPEEIARLENLQMLEWKENIMKSNTIGQLKFKD